MRMKVKAKATLKKSKRETRIFDWRSALPTLAWRWPGHPSAVWWCSSNCKLLVCFHVGTADAAADAIPLVVVVVVVAAAAVLVLPVAAEMVGFLALRSDAAVVVVVDVGGGGGADVACIAMHAGSQSWAI